ncbi:hydrogenase small subunit [Methanosarcina sp. KYL-1]|uniref:hydrogenase small subunit n=1 Tax=Methanosarcina sp. KYL-1 TaxID=2602068 RepID=UPI0021014D89|nr:hydrogenase small subunit [Methanosarcina sp. KYL-1]
MDRRTFLKAACLLGASAFLGTYRTELVSALEMAETKIVWLHGAECTGCTESLLNGGDPDVIAALSALNTKLAYHETLLAGQGIFVDDKPANNAELNSEILVDELITEGNYILVVEGAIPNGPNGSGRFFVVGDRTFKELFAKAAGNASAILAVGTCAAYGGINSASSAIAQLTDYRGVAFKGADSSGGMLRELGINKPVINIPGCPAHPDWILLTLSAVVLGKIKVPSDLPSVLDRYGRPRAYFDEDVHDECPRHEYYERDEFDTEIGGHKCLLKLGCKGKHANADCSIRKWNGGASMCVQAGSPCIACVEPGFPDSSRPFYQPGSGSSLEGDSHSSDSDEGDSYEKYSRDKSSDYRKIRRDD